MAIVIDKECKVTGGKLIVVLEDATLEGVINADAKRLAIAKAAACGYVGCGISNTSGPYPVDAEGNTSDDYDVLVKMSQDKKLVGYRNDFSLASGI